MLVTTDCALDFGGGEAIKPAIKQHRHVEQIDGFGKQRGIAMKISQLTEKTGRDTPTVIT